ncbi:ATP-grasp domain-containing protein [Patescibacteria group bacterium]|nr:ATP-grasp domain-containing protein [Patescibacteria group bacterium]MBU4580065.1 ATP-grasp domain-containing protein [Patescibacteria group bacterium]
MAYSVNNLDDINMIFEDLKTPIFYVSNVVDRGIGLENIIPNYHIICIDYDDEVDYLEKAGAKIFCLEKELGRKNVIFRSSAILLGHEAVKKYIKENTPTGTQAAVVVFKPSLAAEKIALENNWKILNNSTILSKAAEDKFNFIFIAKSLRVRIPDAETIDFGRLSYWELKKYYDYFVVQLNSGYAGSSTFFIRSQDDYIKLRDAFFHESSSKRTFPVKVSKFIHGVPATVNACVAREDVYVGKPCYQITGEELATNNRSTTCGNDWGALSLSTKAFGEINEIGQKIGQYLKDKGYKGIFGLDFIISEKNDDVYLIEINPRFVASIPFYTKLEIKNSALPLLALHFLDFLEIEYEISSSAKELFDKNTLAIFGSQLVLRNKERKICAPSEEARSGVYRLKNGKLDFLRPGYSPMDLKTPNEFIILAAAKGRMIKPENEAARIESLASFVSCEHHLTADAELIAREVYEKLKLIIYR